jgi:hypothetical protein
MAALPSSAPASKQTLKRSACTTARGLWLGNFIFASDEHQYKRRARDSGQDPANGQKQWHESAFKIYYRLAK